ncbi:MAG: carboxypeptidase regulatory-like domain-containing protein [Deltaproteobacteria bacterium]|nr:carboxypeptidase regulatory-like domain-containing protein [Deltaproteobacteria bacterium]
MERLRTMCLGIAAFALFSGTAFGAYHHMDEQDAPKFLKAYPDKAGTKLDDCASCHKGNTYTTKSGAVVTESACQYCHKEYGYDGSGDIAKTLNPFGADYNTAGRNVAALEAIEGLDSDNDTYSNITEINAIRYPGDKLDTPAKVPAPHIILSLDELESMFTPHEQFMLMNTSRGGESGFDYYVTYTGFIMQELLAGMGWTAASSGITVTAPDGYSYTYARTSTGTNYPIEGTYPQAQYFYDATADEANGGWVDYSAPGCAGRNNGDIIAVPGGLKLLLAHKANGAYLDIAYQDDANKLVGEGPFRAVPPQWRPGYPDRQATSATPGAEPWPYDKNEVYTDHNAGFSARGVAAIRVDPLPEGTTEYDWRNSQTDAGWGLLNDQKIVIYGNLRNGNIKGTVVSRVLQKPIANALLKTDMGGYETRTDTKGQFMLMGVVSGPENDEKSYTLTVSAENYRSQTEDVTVSHGDNQTVAFSLEYVECLQDSDCPDDSLYCTGAPVCTDEVCGFAAGPCGAGEICDEGSDECICDVEWDLDGDCDVDKYDSSILKLRQKNEKTALSNLHKAEKAAMKAALGSSGDCDAEWDLDDDCDVDKDDSKLLKLRQKGEKTADKERHKAEKEALKAASVP